MKPENGHRTKFTHTNTIRCITNDGTLIATTVYLPLHVMDDPSLPSGQSDQIRKRIDTFLTTCAQSSFWVQHTLDK